MAEEEETLPARDEEALPRSNLHSVVVFSEQPESLAATPQVKVLDAQLVILVGENDSVVEVQSGQGFFVTQRRKSFFLFRHGTKQFIGLGRVELSGLIRVCLCPDSLRRLLHSSSRSNEHCLSSHKDKDAHEHVRRTLPLVSLRVFCSNTLSLLRLQCSVCFADYDL
ncbi:hypothetical protein LR48_Vigan01g053100 [Vigna angularis]|uniref:Uncharacterized protein n=1 Tax=Phaseolus angularis TaxID=3914 RepID=A0A0L9TKH9_PHAAN|nr:hypothetical protein LR48_Vigan01g053100 [Vigna angularis]